MQELLVIAALFADPEPVTPPKGPPPSLTYMQSRRGLFVRWSMQAIPVTEARIVEVVEGGKTIKKMVTVTKYVMQTVAVEMSPKDMIFSTAGGKKLETADAVKRLADGALVVLSANGAAVDAAFLRALKPETLVVIQPLGAPTPAITPPIRIRPGVIIEDK